MSQPLPSLSATAHTPPDLTQTMPPIPGRGPSQIGLSGVSSSSIAPAIDSQPTSPVAGNSKDKDIDLALDPKAPVKPADASKSFCTKFVEGLKWFGKALENAFSLLFFRLANCCKKESEKFEALSKGINHLQEEMKSKSGETDDKAATQRTHAAISELTLPRAAREKIREAFEADPSKFSSRLDNLAQAVAKEFFPACALREELGKSPFNTTDVEKLLANGPDGLKGKEPFLSWDKKAPLTPAQQQQALDLIDEQLKFPEWAVNGEEQPKTAESTWTLVPCSFDVFASMLANTGLRL